MISEDRILYADNHLIAVLKYPGDLVQGDSTGDTSLADEVKAYIKHKYNKPGEVYLGIVHRIDRPVGGVVLFARTSKAASRLSNAIRERTWDKTYLAITEKWNAADSGKLIDHLRKNAKQNKSYKVEANSSGGKEARLAYDLIGHLDNYSLLKVKLETGRHHQIRAQLSLASSPIRGDLKYGARRSNKDGSIDLLAWRLKFMHPVQKEEVLIEVPIPSSWPKEVHSILEQYSSDF